MTNRHDSKFLDDPQFQSLLVACLESLERGETIDRDALAKDYPKYASEVAQFLEDRQLLEQVATEFGDVEPSHVAIRAYEQTLDSNAAGSDFSEGDVVRYIGEYEILEEIARGGMGVVFKARQKKLNRIVALKMILAGRLADAADVERFQREAQAAGRLKHPNIVPVHEIGEHDGRHYFTMDFVDGPSLAEELREETLAARRAARIVQVAADAVHFAHESGTVHRDLKPANILLTDDGAPHITDFGLAKILQAVDEDSRAELTASGQILGTPSYMSPEQASGKQDLVGIASDIYSLGAILYACLTGRAPFVADSPVDTLLQVMRKEPVSPRDLNPSVPKDLETICLKCLSKVPSQRYATADGLADDLGRFLEGRPVVARPIGPIRRYYRWCQRNPVVAALVVLLFASMAVGTLVASKFSVDAMRQARRAELGRREAEMAHRAAEVQRVLAEEAQLEAERQAEAAKVARAQAEWSFSQEADARIRAQAGVARPNDLSLPERQDRVLNEIDALDNLDFNDAGKRVEVLHELAKMGPDAAFAVPKLLPMLRRPDSYEKILVIRCLASIGPKAATAVPALHEILKSETSLAGPRAEAGQALARMGSAGAVAIPTLIERLKNPGEPVKIYLATKPDQDNKGPAVQLFRTDEKGTYTQIRDMVLMQVLSSLARFGPAAREALPEIEHVLADPDTLEGVRVVALTALRTIQAEDDQ